MITKGSKPAPFKRPTIDVGRHGRAWVDVKADKIHIGDIIADFGLVANVTHIAYNYNTSNYENTVELTNIAGTVKEFLSDDVLKAFILFTETTVIERQL